MKPEVREAKGEGIAGRMWTDPWTKGATAGGQASTQHSEGVSTQGLEVLLLSYCC